MLIAEIGNNHFGSMTKAKQLIKAAHEAGADIVKAQAFHARDIKSGSMQKEFYEMCEFSVPEYLELIQYARDIGNDLFYSIFSTGFDALRLAQKWHKIAGPQTRKSILDKWDDADNLIISIPSEVECHKLKQSGFQKAEMLYVSEYMTKDPKLDTIDRFQTLMGKRIGYSDHTMGIRYCMEAVEKHGVQIIEKHFCLNHNETYSGQVFRDTVHGATPAQFEKLALKMYFID